MTLDTATYYALRAALIAVLRILERPLPEDERALKPSRRQKGGRHG